MPTAKDLGFEWGNELLLAPGEAAALQKLEEFCDGQSAIFEYNEQRDFPAIPGTSTLSAALKFGTIGIRTVWQAADQATAALAAKKPTANIRTWQQELAWREFYQSVMYFFP